MKSFELALLSRTDLQTVVFYWDHGYSIEALEALTARWTAKTLILTGPAAFAFPGPWQVKPLEELIRERPRVQALVFAGVWDWSPLKSLKLLEPELLAGELRSEDSFALWECFRTTARQIHIDSTGREPGRTLRWSRGTGPALSILFPVYGVEAYLPLCLETVTAWKAPYVEFLFINDGSPDRSRDIILQWAGRDSRIRLIDKENGGCASARQLGLEQARGAYVGFVDPDDFVNPMMFRKLLSKAMSGSYEIACCGYQDYFQDTGSCWPVEDVLGWPYDQGTEDRDRIRDLAVFSRVAIWRGIYSRAMLQRENIGFYTDLRRFDDLPFKVETFFGARSLVTVPEYLYYYRLSRPGQDVSADDQRLFVHFEIFQHLNGRILSRNDRQLVDNLQLCKIQTHRYAVDKIQRQYLKDYVRQAARDLQTTGSFLRTLRLAKRELGKRAALYYLGLTLKSTMLLRLLRRKE